MLEDYLYPLLRSHPLVISVAVALLASIAIAAILLGVLEVALILLVILLWIPLFFMITDLAERGLEKFDELVG